MLRAAWIVFQNEFRLLARDRTSFFMLAVAPLVIITVAGFSLGNLYGVQRGAQPYYIVVVDEDHGWLARALVKALASDHAVAVVLVANVEAARAVVTGRARAPLSIEIPPGTTTAFEDGRDVALKVSIDPVKRLEAAALELDIDRLCRVVTARAHARARRVIAQQSAHLREQFAQAAEQMKAAAVQVNQLRSQFDHARATAQAAIALQTSQALEQVRAAMTARLDRSMAQTRTAVEQDLASRRDALRAVTQYLAQLQASRQDFATWLAALKAAAGSRASAIPAPPQWPVPPTKAQLAELARPLELPAPRLDPASVDALPKIVVRLPAIPELHGLGAIAGLDALSPSPAMLPGTIGYEERAIAGGAVTVSAFDQYVPGFGITFLLIDMLWGVGVGLIDERDWGILARLFVSGAPASGLMLGKLGSRFLIGLGQMILLFGVGWLLFGIALGKAWWALLLPAAAIAFAAAAFSLVIACIANSRDAVLPIGAMAALAMSAIGGCWWPLDFEPHWMRTIALAIPTTWTMEAFNNLMIRGLDASSAVGPSGTTFAIGACFLVIGILFSARLYRHEGQ